MLPGPEVLERIERLRGRKVRAVEETRGGFTDAGRWLIEFQDGSTAFAKLGTKADTAEWLRQEARVYKALRADFMPELYAYQDQAAGPLLLLEDLGMGGVAPPWTPARVGAVLAALAMLHEIDVSRLDFVRPLEVLTAWDGVADDPEPFLALGLVSPRWFDRNLRVLLQAQSALDPRGDSLLHLDVRSDNLRFVDGRARLFDWNHASLGRREIDIGFWLPSLAAEGGPLPGEILPGEPEIAAWVSGFFAFRAGQPPLPRAPGVRVLQRTQLRTALAWAVDELGLDPPDGPSSG